MYLSYDKACNSSQEFPLFLGEPHTNMNCEGSSQLMLCVDEPQMMLVNQKLNIHHHNFHRRRP
jgi:hypothetical protein